MLSCQTLPVSRSHLVSSLAAHCSQRLSSPIQASALPCYKPCRIPITPCYKVSFSSLQSPSWEPISWPTCSMLYWIRVLDRKGVSSCNSMNEKQSQASRRRHRHCFLQKEA